MHPDLDREVARRSRRAPDNPHHARRWLILAVLGIAQLMVVLDATVVNIALPTAQHALGFSDNARQWVVTAYALAFGSLLLIGGRLADLVGRKRMFLIGLVGFAAASAVGGAATSFAMLVTARAAQGAFGALLAPAGPGTAHHHVHPCPGAWPRIRHLRRDRRRRRGHRPAARRRAHRVRLMARGRCSSTWSSPRSRSSAARLLLHNQRSSPPAEARLARNGHRLRRPVRPRLRLLARRDGGLGQRRDASGRSSPPRSCSPPSS